MDFLALDATRLEITLEVRHVLPFCWRLGRWGLMRNC